MVKFKKGYTCAYIFFVFNTFLFSLFRFSFKTATIVLLGKRDTRSIKTGQTAFYGNALLEKWLEKQNDQSRKIVM